MFLLFYNLFKSSCSLLMNHVQGVLSALSIVWGYVRLSRFVGSYFAAMKPELRNEVIINIYCKEPLSILSGPSVLLHLVLWLTSLRLASEF